MFNPTARRSLLVSAALLALVVTPRSQGANMSYEAAVSDALTVAAQRADLSVMRVAGQSMLPYFSDDAVILVKKIDAARLRVGMIAVYVNRFGEKVAHRVIAPSVGGWQVKGYNNDAADSTVVNGGNLLGIVYGTFHSAGRAPVTVAAANLPAVETVYAAPAR